MLQQMVLIVEITFFKCCGTERWFELFRFPYFMVDLRCCSTTIWDVAVHIFRCCSTYFSMLHYLYSDVALHSLHNFAMLHLKVFRAFGTGARWGNRRGGGQGARVDGGASVGRAAAIGVVRLYCFSIQSLRCLVGIRWFLLRQSNTPRCVRTRARADRPSARITVFLFLPYRYASHSHSHLTSQLHMLERVKYLLSLLLLKIVCRNIMEPNIFWLFYY